MSSRDEKKYFFSRQFEKKNFFRSAKEPSKEPINTKISIKLSLKFHKIFHFKTINASIKSTENAGKLLQ